MRKRKWFRSSVSLTDGEERAWVVGISLETIAVFLRLSSGEAGRNPFGEGEDVQKAS